MRLTASIASALVALAACGRFDFTASDSDARAGSDGDAAAAPPSPTVIPAAVVDANGNVNTDNEADGTHMVFVDNSNAHDLVVFREGIDDTTLRIDVSPDNGVTWNEIDLAAPDTNAINALGATQDSQTHAFHVSWLDASVSDQYARLVPTYSGGHITGFTVAAHFGFFDDDADSPSPRDLAEIVDGDGVHRLVFIGAATAGTAGRVKLSMTTPSVGLAPTSQNDWAAPTDHTRTGSDDALLPNNYTTNDDDTTYMVSVSSNVLEPAGAPVLALAGFPADRDLFVWSLTPMPGGDFTIGAKQTVTAAFGGGTGLRTDASLSVTTSASGAWFAYSTDSSTTSGMHLGELAADGGSLAVDAAPQPTTSAAARHAAIAAAANGDLGLFYADGAGAIDATLLWNGGWLKYATAQTTPTPIAAWSLATPWELDGGEAFGLYSDDGSAATTTFAAVTWK